MLTRCLRTGQHHFRCRRSLNADQDLPAKHACGCALSWLHGRRLLDAACSKETRLC
jgi:hypothetical protein